MPVRCCRSAKNRSTLGTPPRSSERGGLAGVAGQRVVAEAMDALLERRGGDGDGQLERDGDEDQRDPEPQQDLQEDAADHQRCTCSRPHAAWRSARRRRDGARASCGAGSRGRRCCGRTAAARGPRAPRASSSRRTTVPAARSSSSRSVNSTAVSSTGAPARRTVRRPRSMATSSRPSVSARALARQAGLGLRPAQDRADPRHQLARIERLGQVVVGAQLEAHDAIHVVAARGEHQHRHLGRGADAAQEIEAADAGQHHVEHRQLVVPGDGAVERVGAVGLGVEREAFACEVLADQLGQLHVVVHQQDPRHGHLEPAMAPFNTRSVGTRVPGTLRIVTNARRSDYARGSRASRIASPTKFRPITVTNRAAPGPKTIHGACWR